MTRRAFDRLGARGDLDPHRRAVDAPHAQQVVGDGAVRRQPVDENGPGGCLRETRRSERFDVVFRRVGGVAEDQFEMRVRGNGEAPQRISCR